LPRLPRARLPLVRPSVNSLFALVRTRLGLRSWRFAQVATATWCARYRYAAVMSALVLVTSVGIGFAISRL
jgi:hypothetical protein